MPGRWARRPLPWHCKATFEHATEGSPLLTEQPPPWP